MSSDQLLQQRESAFREAMLSNNPSRIAAVFQIPPPDNNNNNSRNSRNIRNIRARTFQDSNGLEWGSVLTSLLSIIANSNQSSSSTSVIYEHQSTLHQQFNHVFSSSPGNILVPALHTICKTTMTCAIQADEDANHMTSDDNNNKTTKTSRNDRKNLQRAVTLLQESFSKTLNDRKEIENADDLDRQYTLEGSKKIGVLPIVNLLFAMYFRLNTLRLCKNLLRPVESRSLHVKAGAATVGDRVTYRYYVGRLHMFEDHYGEAEENLEYALVHCHGGAVANKKRILNYLLPVKLLRGRLPTNELLQKYSLHEFLPLVQGLKRGDLQTFNAALQRHQDLFIRRGTYLLLEKCKTVCYRNLFKRVHKIVTGGTSSQLHLDHLAKSFRYLGMEDVDLDEIECILANLIFRGYVRGYLSHSKRTLVLSKKDPFPKSAIVKS